MFILLVLVIISLVLYHCLTHYSRHGRLLNKLPGPPGIPLLGSLLMFMIPPTAVWNVVRKMNEKYYPISTVWLAHKSGINIRHPDDAEILLSSMKHIEKSAIYHLLHPWLGTGLLTSAGNKWQTRRKMLTPAFHYGVLQQFLDIFIEHGNNLVKYLKSQGDDTIQDVVSLGTKYALNAICETAMGTSLHDADIQDQYRTAVRTVGNCAVYRLFRPWLAIEWLYKLLPSGRTETKYVTILHDFSDKIIKERKQYHEETGGQYLKSLMDADEKSIPLDDDIKSRKRKMAMLDHLIASQTFGNKIDDLGIREEVDTFIFEGHDTTAMAICFTLLMLAEHKDIQERARQEVDQVLGESNAKIGMSEIQRLSYLEQCVRETLRLYPSVPFISRVINEDVQFNNYLIPGGTLVSLHIYDLHRDPNFWPDPNTFDPDRFVPEKMLARHPFSYIPFSGGPRNCIGQKFAILELKSLIAQLLHNFYLEPIDLSRDIIFTADLVIRPAVPIRIKFVTRTK